MARSSLLELLPDYSEHRPARLRQGPAGFEPLVHAALSKEGFSALDMPVGFTGLAPEAEPDPLAAFDDDGAGELGTLDGLEVADDSDFPDLTGDLADLSREVDASEAEIAPPPAPQPEQAASPELDDFDTAAADAIAAQDALETAHREEIERIQAAHREALESLLKEAIPRAKQEIADALAADLAALLTGRLRAGFVMTAIDALSRKVSEVLDDASAVSFDLRGPEYLISAFLETWKGDAAQIRTIPDDSVELVARIDRAVIATRLSEFDHMIEEATE